MGTWNSSLHMAQRKELSSSWKAASGQSSASSIDLAAISYWAGKHNIAL